MDRTQAMTSSERYDDWFASVSSRVNILRFRFSCRQLDGLTTAMAGEATHTAITGFRTESSSCTCNGFGDNFSFQAAVIQSWIVIFIVGTQGVPE
jgi:hypothetical protein